MLEKADILSTNDARKHGNTEHKRFSVIPSFRAPYVDLTAAVRLEEAVSPGSRDREGDARTLYVQEQPLAVGTVSGTRKLAGAKVAADAARLAPQ
jgi:hypothetical protein